MRNKIGAVCMVLGAMLVLAALSLFLWNRRQDRQAGAYAQALLPLVIDQIGAQPVNDPTGPAMTETEIDGGRYIGYLSIPALALELPVQAQWDEERLAAAPCRYAGSTRTDDLVIAAHNYTRHFGRLSRLAVGDAVCFTDMAGVMSLYEVAAMETLAPDAVEEMTAGVYDLTLFTCTYSGMDRLAVRCERTVLEQGTTPAGGRP